jgi:hypothetical protein
VHSMSRAVEATTRIPGVDAELDLFVYLEEGRAPRKLEADQESDECNEHCDPGPKQVKKIERRNLGRAIGRNKCPTMLAAELSEKNKCSPTLRKGVNSGTG